MRTHRITGVVVASALVATLAGGALSTTAAAATPADTTPAGRLAAPAAPDATALLAQAKSLGDLASVITPVTKLVQDLLAKPGTVTPEAITADVTAVKTAIDAAKAAAPAVPAAPAAPALPGVPSLGTPGKATVPGKATAPGKAATTPSVKPAKPSATRDVKADALTALQTAVDNLVKASSAGDPAGLLTAATAVITGLVNVAVATVLSGGLPAPNLPGLPALPSLPAAPGLPL